MADLKARTAQEAKAAQIELADDQKKIAADAAEIESLKSAHTPEDAREIATERDKLKEELAARTKDLADAEAHRDPKVADLLAQMAEVERKRDELKAKLDAVSAPAATTASTDAQVDQLRARLAVLEAQAVPYTAEELAIMKPSSSAPAPTPLPPPAQALTSSQTQRFRKANTSCIP